MRRWCIVLKARQRHRLECHVISRPPGSFIDIHIRNRRGHTGGVRSIDTISAVEISCTHACAGTSANQAGGTVGGRELDRRSSGSEGRVVEKIRRNIRIAVDGGGGGSVGLWLRGK